MRKLICAVLLFTCTYGIAQNENGLWKKSNSNKTSERTLKSNLPQKNIFDLDLPALKAMLAKSPKRDSFKNSSNTIITLPNGEGKMENFKVYENSVMAPELAAKYSEIKSYLAVGVDNTNARAYFSYSPLGFKSMTIYPNQETVFIEPISSNNATYSVYKKSDKEFTMDAFECGVIDAATNTHNRSTSTFARGADDSKLRTYRLALSCTGEYAAYFGGTKALALAGMVNTMTRVNGIFERDFGVRLVLIANNDNVIYTNATTDPYSTKAYWPNELQSNLTSTIGDANYDIGHFFDSVLGGGNAGCIGCIGVDGSKGSGYTSTLYAPEGDVFDVKNVAHEIGHQLGANHSFTYRTEIDNFAQMEPGSGSTIMSYAGTSLKDTQEYPDAYFHAISIQQVTDNLKTKTCGTITNTGNAAPVVNAGLDFTIPKGTPFMLTGSATDANTNDALTYTWEQMDLGNATTTVPTATATTGPLFRSYMPTASSTRYFPNMTTILAGLTTTQGYRIASEVLPGVARTLNFRLTVRDNRAGGAANNTDDAILTVNGVAGPFTVDTQNTTATYAAGTTQTINWTVAGTNANGVNCANVDILLSTDNGVTFPITLLAGTPNDGSQSIVIPNTPGTTNRIMVKGSNHIFFDVNNANFTITGSGSTDTTAPTASTLSSSGTTTSSTNLSWTAATDNVGVTGYNVYQNGVLKTTTTATSLAVSGLSASTAYSFYVKAKDATGNLSTNSNTVNVTTLSAGVSYCNSVGGTVKEYINSVQMGTINNLSGNNNGYGNYTTLSTSVALGSTTSITITPAWNGMSTNEAYCVWIDFNQDGNFGSNELVFSKSKNKSTSVSGSIIIPSTAVTGNTRMRVSMKYNALPTACEMFTNGEVEDYTVNIVKGVTVKTETNDETTTKNDSLTEKQEISRLSFNVYPNPVKGDMLYFSGIESNTSYRIFNMMGQQMRNGNTNDNSINVGSLMQGVYIIEITDGASVGTKKFIKG
jgi:hypothetical protein